MVIPINIFIFLNNVNVNVLLLNKCERFRKLIRVLHIKSEHERLNFYANVSNTEYKIEPFI